MGGRILPNSRAIVLQQCGQCRRAGRRKGRLIRAQTTNSKRLSCKGQHAQALPLNLALDSVFRQPGVYLHDIAITNVVY